MSRISKAFLTGLAAILPIVITVYILIWFCSFAENTFGAILRHLLPARFYYTGMGFVVGIVVTTLLGLLLQAWIVRKFFRFGEKVLHRLPVIRIVYGAARDLIGFFSDSKKKSFSQVVLVTVGENIRQLGLVTREDFSGCPEGIADENTVAVYFPMSYQVGGPTLLVPRSAIEPLDMSFPDAMRFALTAGMSLQNNSK